jgi:Ca2+-binding EF-hand superfamily protein
LAVLKHHLGELIERDFTIAVSINLLDDLVDDFFVEVLTETEDLLDLVGRDGTTAILIEHLESSLELVVAEQVLLVHGSNDEFRVINSSTSISIDLVEHLIDFFIGKTLTEVFAFIASQLLSKNEKESIDKVFRAMDVNGDGKLSKEEIKNGYAEYFGKSLSDEEIDEMFDKVDADGSGAIDYSEFVVATMNEKNLLSNNKLQTAFKMFDKDGGGSISTDEIKQVLSFGQNLDEEVVN